MKKNNLFGKCFLACLLLLFPSLKTISVSAQIIGLDDRNRITEYRHENLSIVKLIAIYSDGDKRIGTGAFISAKKILTSAHIVYNSKKKKKAKTIQIKSPYSFSTVLTLQISSPSKVTPIIYPKYIRSKSSDNDLAVLTLTNPLTGVQPFQIGTSPCMSPFLVLKGYSPSAKTLLYQQKAAWNFISDETLSHNFDTESGQSGSPIFGWPAWPRYSDSYIVAVHSGYNNAVNYATRITEEKKKWMERIK